MACVQVIPEAFGPKKAGYTFSRNSGAKVAALNPLIKVPGAVPPTSSNSSHDLDFGPLGHLELHVGVDCGTHQVTFGLVESHTMSCPKYFPQAMLSK